MEQEENKHKTSSTGKVKAIREKKYQSTEYLFHKMFMFHKASNSIWINPENPR